MSTTTSRLSLYKTASDGSEYVNVVTDLLNNYDTLDLNIGYRDCTSTTRPSTVWKGLPIRESDTGRLYVSNGTSPASASWTEIPSASAAVLAAMTFTGAMTLGSTLRTVGAVFLNSTLAVTGATTLNSNLTVTGTGSATTLGGTLTVTGAFTGASNVNTGAGTPYVPTWTSASNPQPALGTSTLVGRQVRRGRLIRVDGSLQIAGGATGGTGTWQFALPAPAATVTGMVWTGAALYENVGDNYYVGVAEVRSGAAFLTCTVKTGTSSSSAAPVTTSSPVTASANTFLRWSVEYEAAS